MEFLSEFVLNWEYRPGKLGVAPDALSRVMTIVCEPGWLGRVFRAQVAKDNEEMVKYYAKGQSSDG